jgi:hypothetical protein
MGEDKDTSGRGGPKWRGTTRVISSVSVEMGAIEMRTA